MLILRRLTKLFARRDVFLDSLRKEYELNEKLIKECNGKIVIDTVQSDTFKEQYKHSTNQARIDKLVNDLKNSNAWFDDEEDTLSDTHYLEDYSSKSKGFVMFSKKINNKDRLNYRIYKPQIIKDKKTMEKMYYQKIVLDTCLDHSISGKSGSYVKGQTGTTWHSPKKSRKRNRLKKDDLN